MKSYPLNISPYTSQEDFLNAKISTLKDLCDFFNCGTINKSILNSNMDWVERFIMANVLNRDVYIEDIISIINAYFSADTSFKPLREFLFDKLRIAIIKRSAVTDYASDELPIKSRDTIGEIRIRSLDCGEDGLPNKHKVPPLTKAILILYAWSNPISLSELSRGPESNAFTSHGSFADLLSIEFAYSYDLSNQSDLDLILKNGNAFAYDGLQLIRSNINSGGNYYNEKYLKSFSDPEKVMTAKIINKFADMAFLNLLHDDNKGRTIAGGKYSLEILNTLQVLLSLYEASIIQRKFAGVENVSYLIDDLVFALSFVEDCTIIDKVKEIRQHFSYVPTNTFIQVLHEIIVTRNVNSAQKEENEKLFSTLSSIISSYDVPLGKNFYHYEDVEDPDKDISDALIELDTLVTESAIDDDSVSHKRYGAGMTRNKYGKLVFATEASTDKSGYRADKRIQQSEKLQQVQNNTYKFYKTFKTNEDKIDSQLTKIVRALKNKIFKTDPDQARDELIEGNKWTVFKVLKKVLAGAAIFSVSKVFTIVIILVRAFTSRKVKASEKKKLITELKNEIAIVDEKISDAQSAGDRKAKYELMRIKNSLQSALDKISASYKGTPDAGLAEANKILSEKRGK